MNRRTLIIGLCTTAIAPTMARAQPATRVYRVGLLSPGPAPHITDPLMVALSERNQPVDAITLTDALRTGGVLEAVGGAGYIAELAACVPTAANAGHYSRIVREKALLRSLASIATEIASGAYDAPPNVDQRAEIDSRRAGGFAIAAGQATVQVPLRRARWRMAFEHLLDQIDSAARAVQFVAQQLIGRAGRQAKTAVHALAQNRFSLRTVARAPKFLAQVRLHGARPDNHIQEYMRPRLKMPAGSKDFFKAR